MNETKKNTGLKIVVAILAFALVGCFIWVNTLNNEINRLSNAMHSQHQQFMNQVESIYSNVDRQLKEEASLLSGFEVEYGEINLDDHTIDVTVKLVPKLISEDMKVSISINGRSADLIKSGSAFAGTIPVDVYNLGELILMSIETEAGTQTQYLSEIQVEYLWDTRIPSLYYCDVSGQGSFTDGKYTFDGHIDINCSSTEQTPDVRFEKFVLVTERNGTEINREDITDDVMNYDAYPHGVYWRDEYKMECEAKEGDDVRIYLEATDSLGYLHRMLIHQWREQNGAMAEAVDASEYIYAPDGTSIYP